MAILVMRKKDDQGNPVVDMPYKKYIKDGGYDLYSPFDIVLQPGQSVFIDSGYHFLLPTGWTGLIRPRSSTYRKRILTNGTIDSGYTGEVVVGLENRSDEIWSCRKGDRVVQIIPVFTGAGLADLLLRDQTQGLLIFRAVTSMLACDEIEEVMTMPVTERSENGFGSTGE